MRISSTRPAFPCETQQHEAEENTVFDRELFYAMQPRQRLLEMIDHYRIAFAVA